MRARAAAGGVVCVCVWGWGGESLPGSLTGSFKMVPGTRARPLGPPFDVAIPVVAFAGAPPHD